MDFVIPFVSVIGVIIGFLLSTIKELWQSRALVKITMKTGIFNYYKVYFDELNQKIVKETDAESADYYDVNLKLDIYNCGKGNTAIKSIDAINIVNNKLIIVSDVQIKISDKQITSFNLPASSIFSLDVFWRVKKEENTDVLFDDEKISLEKDRLKFRVVVTNIKNKEYTILVEPLGIQGAY